MPNLKWTRPKGPSVGATGIQRVEDALGVRFPPSLVDIYRSGDGLRPELQWIVKDGEAIDVFARLFRLGGGELFEARKTLLFVADNFDHKAEGLVPVADNGDGWICLDYRDHAKAIDPPVVSYLQTEVDGQDENGLVHLASNFDELLEMLGPYPEAAD